MHRQSGSLTVSVDSFESSDDSAEDQDSPRKTPRRVTNYDEIDMDNLEEITLFDEVDVAIVGDGPVGLAYAWGLKKANPALNVVLFKKDKERDYKRHFTVQMRYDLLSEFMSATDAESEQDLKELLVKLKKDPRVSIDEIERIFTKIAKAKGVNIVNKKISSPAQHAQLTHFIPKHNPRLIICADGMDSNVGRRLTAKGNQIEHEFDYVLRFQYEIEKEVQTPYDRFCNEASLADQGIIASEHIGEYRGGLTPVILQLMITKEEYEKLNIKAYKRSVTSAQSSDDSDDDIKGSLKELNLSKRIDQFLYDYLKHRLADTNEMLKERIKVNVKKVTAMHTANIYSIWEVKDNHSDKTNEVPVLLVGDAALHLSYFKGLNAALEAATWLIPPLACSFDSSANNVLKQALRNYNHWFVNVFAPTKIMQVAEISKVIRQDENASSYPHRLHPIVHFAQLAYVPLTYTLRKMGKIFADFAKPYKSGYQAARDFGQPFIGLIHVGLGIIKMLKGVFTLRFMLSLDGFFSVLRGLLEMVTAPLAWSIKPLSRLIATGVADTPIIEKEEGMHRLAELGYEKLVESGVSTSNVKIKEALAHETLAVCHDLHRKFDKAYGRGQESRVAVEERTSYNLLCDLNSSKKLDNTDTIKNYFRLFASDVVNKENKDESEEVVVRKRKPSELQLRATNRLGVQRSDGVPRTPRTPRTQRTPRADTPRIDTPRDATPRKKNIRQ